MEYKPKTNPKQFTVNCICGGIGRDREDFPAQTVIRLRQSLLCVVLNARDIDSFEKKTMFKKLF